jgi:two-component system, LytTR family, sensor kinase
MFVSAIWIAPAVLAIINHAAQPRLHNWSPVTARDLLFAGGDWLIYAFLTPPIFWIADRWPIARPHVARRAAFHLGVSLLFCVAWALGGTVLRLVLGRIFSPQDFYQLMEKAGAHFWQTFATEVLSWILTTLPFGVIVYLTVAGMAHAIRYFVEASDRDVQLARLSEQLSSARFAALQAQLNPHFLFNTLNTIAVRARDGDGAGTVRIVEQLSDVLRRTLSRHQANEVTLDEEMDLVRQYLAIEQARFPDRLRPVFEADPSLGAAAVPSFALQHLVENAIRHGIARQPGAGRLRIGARRDGDTLVLVVEDDGAGIDEAAAQVSRRGLANTRARLQALYGSRATLEAARRPQGGTLATLRLPYHEVPPEESR